MKPLTINDYPLIKAFLDEANYEGYNSNFITMMMWNHEFHIEYEIHDHFLIMLHHYKDKHFWAMPFTSKEYYKDAIDYMIVYSEKHGFDFMIDCAIKDFVNEIKEIYSNQFLYCRTPYNDDYVYDKEMLMTLSGKKMQKRRNHYNAFKKRYPDYVYKEIDLTDDFNEVLDCLTKWESDKKELSESLSSEIYGIMYLLSSKNILDFKAGAIYIDNKMEAFIIASKLKHKTIQIHVEKANKNIRGLYPAILKKILEHHFKDELYVNREEDMGLENLRKSKLALHPIHMVEKYQIIKNESKVIQADEFDKEKIKDIWLSNFEDENKESTNFYFQNYYDHKNTYLLKNKDEIISVCQIVPWQVSLDNHIENAYFILGVATTNKYQGQGCMKTLLKSILSMERYKDKHIYLQAYHPEIYYSFGFNISHQLKKVIINKDNYLYELDEIVEDHHILKALYDSYCQQYNEFRIRDEHYFQLLEKRCHVFNNTINVFKHNDKYDGYAIYHVNQNEIIVEEIIYKDDLALNRILSTLSSMYSYIVVISDLNAKIEGESTKIIQMLSNHLLDIEFNKKYMNEVY